jgi:hypothetical protein
MFRKHYRLGQCTGCGTESVLRRRVPRHEVHLALTICTLGLWGPCWLITKIAARWEPWRCTRCRRLQICPPPPEDALVPDPAATAVGAGFGLVHEPVD